MYMYFTYVKAKCSEFYTVCLTFPWKFISSSTTDRVYSAESKHNIINSKGCILMESTFVVALVMYLNPRLRSLSP